VAGGATVGGGVTGRGGVATHPRLC
jgi:hypothetical protein